MYIGYKQKYREISIAFDKSYDPRKRNLILKKEMHTKLVNNTKIIGDRQY